MKFLSSLVVYLLIGFVLGWSILLAVKGNPWLLVVSVLVYLAILTKTGCLPGKSH
jgi:hypothetical protein